MYTESIEEMTDEDPGTMSVDAFLDTKFHNCKMLLELRFGDAVQQRCFFDNLTLTKGFMFYT